MFNVGQSSGAGPAAEPASSGPVSSLTEYITKMAKTAAELPSNMVANSGVVEVTSGTYDAKKAAGQSAPRAAVETAVTAGPAAAVGALATGTTTVLKAGVEGIQATGDLIGDGYKYLSDGANTVLGKISPSLKLPTALGDVLGTSYADAEKLTPEEFKRKYCDNNPYPECIACKYASNIMQINEFDLFSLLDGIKFGLDQLVIGNIRFFEMLFECPGQMNSLLQQRFGPLGAIVGPIAAGTMIGLTAVSGALGSYSKLVTRLNNTDYGAQLRKSLSSAFTSGGSGSMFKKNINNILRVFDLKTGSLFSSSIPKFTGPSFTWKNKTRNSYVSGRKPISSASKKKADAASSKLQGTTNNGTRGPTSTGKTSPADNGYVAVGGGGGITGGAGTSGVNAGTKPSDTTTSTSTSTTGSTGTNVKDPSTSAQDKLNNMAMPDKKYKVPVTDANGNTVLKEITISPGQSLEDIRNKYGELFEEEDFDSLVVSKPESALDAASKPVYKVVDPENFSPPADGENKYFYFDTDSGEYKPLSPQPTTKEELLKAIEGYGQLYEMTGEVADPLAVQNSKEYDIYGGGWTDSLDLYYVDETTGLYTKITSKQQFDALVTAGVSIYKVVEKTGDDTELYTYILTKDTIAQPGKKYYTSNKVGLIIPIKEESLYKSSVVSSESSSGDSATRTSPTQRTYKWLYTIADQVYERVKASEASNQNKKPISSTMGLVFDDGLEFQDTKLTTDAILENVVDTEKLVTKTHVRAAQMAQLYGIGLTLNEIKTAYIIDSNINGTILPDDVTGSEVKITSKKQD